jgi:hypothetical protein
MCLYNVLAKTLSLAIPLTSLGFVFLKYTAVGKTKDCVKLGVCEAVVTVNIDWNIDGLFLH